MLCLCAYDPACPGHVLRLLPYDMHAGSRALHYLAVGPCCVPFLQIDMNSW